MSLRETYIKSVGGKNGAEIDIITMTIRQASRLGKLQILRTDCAPLPLVKISSAKNLADVAPRTFGTFTMNSIDIAALVGSRHDSVKRTIERLADAGTITLPPTVEKPTAGRPTTVYVFEGEKGKRDSIIVVAQLSPEFTARLVDRWQELEAQISKPAFDTMAPLHVTLLSRMMLVQCDKCWFKIGWCWFGFF